MNFLNRLAGLFDAFEKTNTPPPRHLLAFMRWCLRGSFKVITLGWAVSMLTGILEVCAAFLLGYVIDAAIDAGAAEFFSTRILSLVGLAFFFVILRPLVFGSNSALTAIAIAPNVFLLTLQRMHRYTMGQDVKFFDNDFAGRIAQKQMQTARAITDVVVESVNVVAFAIASLVGAVVLLSTIGGLVATLLLFWLFGYFALIWFFLPRIRAASKSRAGARAVVTGQIVDTLTNIKTVKLFANDSQEDKAALGSMSILRDMSIPFGILSTGFRFTLMTLAGLLPVLLITGTLWLWSGGAASPGDVATAGSIAIRIAQMTGWVSFTLMQIYASIGEIEDGIGTLTPAHALVDATGARDLKTITGQVTFVDATYTYGNGPGGVRGVSLEIRPGEKIGLVGASGAGKSSLVALLLRLYDLENGQISLDGQDISKVTQESLRNQIGMVTQETAMFNRSARDNLIYGRPGATEAEIITAAKQAEAHEFILALKDHKNRKGYDAHLGERGVKLSGGQRQRIALARAILKNAPILVLDEATSALDSEVEAAIQTALSRAMQGKTVIAIAHRLSTITQMDRILVMEEGRIVEQGGHAEVLAAKSRYANFWERQSGGFIDVNAA